MVRIKMSFHVITILVILQTLLFQNSLEGRALLGFGIGITPGGLSFINGKLIDADQVYYYESPFKPHFKVKISLISRVTYGLDSDRYPRVGDTVVTVRKGGKDWRQFTKIEVFKDGNTIPMHEITSQFEGDVKKGGIFKKPGDEDTSTSVLHAEKSPIWIEFKLNSTGRDSMLPHGKYKIVARFIPESLGIETPTPILEDSLQFEIRKMATLEDSVNVLYHQAEWMDWSGERVQITKKCLELYSDHYVAMTDLGHYYEGKGDYESAITYYGKYLSYLKRHPPQGYEAKGLIPRYEKKILFLKHLKHKTK